MTFPHNVLTFGRRRSFQEAVREQRDCQQERQPSPNDIVFADLEMVVAKAEKLFSLQWASEVLPNRLMLILAAKQLSKDRP